MNHLEYVKCVQLTQMFQLYDDVYEEYVATDRKGLILLKIFC